MRDYLPKMVKLNRRRGKRSYKRNQVKAVGRALTGNVRDLFSMETLKEAGWVAIGTIATPLAAGFATGLVNRNKQIIPTGGILGSVVNLLTGAAVASVATMATGKADVGRLMLLGAYAGVLNDIAVDTILPALGMSDYATLPPGVGDYATLPPNVSDVMPMSDYMDTGDVAGAVSGYSRGEY